MSCLTGPSTTSVTSTTAPPPEVMAAYRNVVGRAQNVSNTPYPGAPQPVAGFTPDQYAAFSAINNAQGVGTPWLNTAADWGGVGGANITAQTPMLSDQAQRALASSAVNQFSGSTPSYWQSALAALPMLMAATGAGSSPEGGLPQGTYAPPSYASSSYGGLPPGTWTGSTGNLPPGISSGPLGDITGGMVPDVNSSTISQYFSPYNQNVIDATQRQFNNQNEMERQRVIGNAISAGAWGGDRAGIAQAELSNQQQLAQAPVIAGLYNQGYGQALSAAQQAQQTGLAKAGLSLQQLQALGQLGLGQQQADISRLGTTGQLGLGQENYGLGLMGTSGQLSLGQQNIGLQRVSQALQALGLGEQSSQAQDQAAMQRAQAAMGAYNQNAQLAAQTAAQSGQLGLGAANFFQGLSNAAQQQALQGASAQMQAGGMQQQLEQERLNAQYQDFVNRYQWPFYTTNFLAGITGNLGNQMGGTSTKQEPGPSPLSQIAGIGLAGLGLWSKLAEGGAVTPETVLKDTKAPPSAPSIPHLAEHPIASPAPVPGQGGVEIFNPLPTPAAPIDLGSTAPANPFGNIQGPVDINGNPGGPVIPAQFPGPPTQEDWVNKTQELFGVPETQTPEQTSVVYDALYKPFQAEWKRPALLSASSHFARGGEVPGYAVGGLPGFEFDTGPVTPFKNIQPNYGVDADKINKDIADSIRLRNSFRGGIGVPSPDLDSSSGSAGTPSQNLDFSGLGSLASPEVKRDPVDMNPSSLFNDDTIQQLKDLGVDTRGLSDGLGVAEKASKQKTGKEAAGDYLSRLTGDPKSLAMVEAGLAMMSGTSPFAGVNIGRGGLQALSSYEKRRDAAAKGEQEERRTRVQEFNASVEAGRLLEEMRSHKATEGRQDLELIGKEGDAAAKAVDESWQRAETARHNRATEALEQQRIDKPSAADKDRYTTDNTRLYKIPDPKNPGQYVNATKRFNSATGETDFVPIEGGAEVVQTPEERARISEAAQRAYLDYARQRADELGQIRFVDDKGARRGYTQKEMNDIIDNELKARKAQIDALTAPPPVQTQQNRSMMPPGTAPAPIQTPGVQQPGIQQPTIVQPGTPVPQDWPADAPPRNLLSDKAPSTFRNGEVWILRNNRPVRLK